LKPEATASGFLFVMKNKRRVRLSGRRPNGCDKKQGKSETFRQAPREKTNFSPSIFLKKVGNIF